jgi:cytochrome P450
VRLSGCEIPRAANLVIDLDAAHRDPDAYPDPGRFDSDRAGPPVLAFGFGAHTCVGAALARLEARILIEQLLMDSVIRSAGEALRGESPDWNNFHYLPVRLERRV